VLVSPNIAVILLFIADQRAADRVPGAGTIVGGIVGAMAFFLSSTRGSAAREPDGLLFIALAVALLVFDLTATQHGALTAGGLPRSSIGVLILFEPS